jgi:membrane protein
MIGPKIRSLLRKLHKRWEVWWHTSESAPARWTRAAHSALLGEMPALAAGTALFAILAVVPLLAAVVAILGLVVDASQIRGHLSGLETVLPQQVVDFIADQLERQAERSSGEVGIQIFVSVVLAMISARGSAQSLLNALNRAYRVRELRGTLHRLALSLGISLATLLGLLTVLTVVVALPGLVATLSVHLTSLFSWLRWPALLAMVFGTLFALFRFGPSPRPLGTDRHVWPGAAISTALLVVVSWGLSEWVERVAHYELFYGAFGSVIVIVLWFYLSTMAIVIGGFVNAELERGSGAPEPDRSMY